MERSTFGKEPELTEMLAASFWNDQWVFHCCDDFDGLLLLSLRASSKSNKNISSVW